MTHFSDVASGESTELAVRAGTWDGEGDGRAGWSALPRVGRQEELMVAWLGSDS